MSPFLPFTVTAHLSSACVPNGPLFLDGLLYFGLGSEMGASSPGGWADEVIVWATPLPLARVETEAGWWWAASQATPKGVEVLTHTHRRTDPATMAEHSSAKTVLIGAGPDKALRVPVYYRPDWTEIRWYGVGNVERVAELLTRVPAVGARRTQGWGKVARWDVQRGGFDVAEFATNIQLRPIPVALMPTPPVGRCIARNMRLRAPYYSGEEMVRCWQVRENQ